MARIPSSGIASSKGLALNQKRWSKPYRQVFNFGGIGSNAALRYWGEIPPHATDSFMLDLLPVRSLWHSRTMCFRITASGDCLRTGSRTLKQEVMLHCARIGYKP
jgi:hypothetical protein